jgi:hypothetical protein
MRATGRRPRLQLPPRIPHSLPNDVVLPPSRTEPRKNPGHRLNLAQTAFNKNQRRPLRTTRGAGKQAMAPLGTTPLQRGLRFRIRMPAASDLKLPAQTFIGPVCRPPCQQSIQRKWKWTLRRPWMTPPRQKTSGPGWRPPSSSCRSGYWTAFLHRSFTVHASSPSITVARLVLIFMIVGCAVGATSAFLGMRL